MASYTAPKEILEEVPVEVEGVEGAGLGSGRRIVDRESDYSKRRLNRTLSPSRTDAFGGQGEDSGRSYAEIMKETQLAQERENTLRNIEKKKREEEEYMKEQQPLGQQKQSRWDSGGVVSQGPSDWESDDKAVKQPSSRWDATPVHGTQQKESSSGRWDSTVSRKSRWDATPTHDRSWKSIVLPE